MSRLLAVIGFWVLVWGAGFPAQAFAGIVGGCNYTLKEFSDRGSVLVFNRSGTLVMQMVLDGDMSVFSKLTFSTSTGDQARQEAKQNPRFAQAMADSHIFPADVRVLNVYLAGPTDGSTTQQATYYGFYGDQGLFLGGFGTNGSDWYVCDWQ